MKLALTAGGTGGHILPALAVLDAVIAARPETEVRFFGPEDRGERLTIESRGLVFETVPAAQVRGRGPTALVHSFWRLGGGILTAVRKLRAFKPDVVFSTGGYGSFPCSVAARLLRKPLIVFLPDVSPGWAVKAEQRLATRMATTTDAALAFLPRKKTRVTGYPVRPVFSELNRESARAKLGILPGERVILVAGASQGSQAINSAVFAGLRNLVEETTVFHITGTPDYDEAAGFKSGLGELGERYHPAPFREDLPEVMFAADLAVMRAGASVLGELPAASLPSILIPGTFAGGHQRENARWLADAGAAIVVEESSISTLIERTLVLLNDEDALAAMRRAAHAVARPGAAAAIASLIGEVARK